MGAEDEKRKTHDCQREVPIDDNFTGYRYIFLKKKEDLETIWDSQLGQMSIAKRQIGLKSGQEIMSTVSCIEHGQEHEKSRNYK